MKNLLLLTLILHLPVFAFAQKITVSEDIILKNDSYYEIIGELKGQTLLFRDQTTEYKVEGFDENMKATWEKELELDKKSANIVGLAADKDFFTVFYQYRQKGSTILKAQRYDPAANMRDSVTVKDFGYLFFTPNFEIVQSEDRSKVLLFFVEKQDVFRVLSFDLNTMQLLWEKSFSPESFLYYEEYLETLVDNEGNMYLILEKDNYRSRRKQHYYEIHAFNGRTDQMNSFNIAMRGRLTYDVKFSFDNLNHSLVAGGLFSEKELSRANGFFYLNIDPDEPKEHLLEFQEFDEDFMASLTGKKADRNKGITEINVQEIVLRRDGGILLIAERNRQFERRSGSTTRLYYEGQSRYMVDYYFEELIVLSVHPDGNTHWKTVLHKKQYSQDDNGVYSSYFLFKSPSSLRFLYNDEIRYENTVSEYVLNGTGEYERNSLLSTRDLELRLRFRDALQISSNVVVVPSERRNRLKLIKMVY